MLSVFCDGGSRGNPGPAAYGFVVKEDGKTIKQEGGKIGVATNNFAEYTALIRALSWLSQNCKDPDLNVSLDSQLVVLQLNGHYKVKNAQIREFVFEVRQLETNFGKVTYTHIPRDLNKEADRMVNLALDGKI